MGLKRNNFNISATLAICLLQHVQAPSSRLKHMTEKIDTRGLLFFRVLCFWVLFSLRMSSGKNASHDDDILEIGGGLLEYIGVTVRGRLFDEF